jgi:hypothetical protein
MSSKSISSLTDDPAAGPQYSVGSRSERPEPEEDLDTEFYGTYYEDLVGLGPPQLSDHWLRVGRSEGRYPNPEAMIRARSDELPADFDVAAYLALNLDVTSFYPKPWQAVLHYLKFGKSEERRYRFERAAEVSLEVGVAAGNEASPPERLGGSGMGAANTGSAKPGLDPGRTATPPAEQLDVAFYTSYHRDLASLTPSEAAEHWARHAKTKAASPTSL